MTHFEYVSVGASFVFALVVARLISVIPHMLDPARRYWIHTAWVAQVLLMTAAAWWNLWSWRTDAPTPLAFLALLSYPALLYLRAALLVPDTPGAVRSWEEHFFERRVPFFAVTALAPINILVTESLLRPGTFSLEFHGPMIGGVAVGLVGCLSANRVLHTILPALALSGGFVWFVRSPVGLP